MLTFKLSNNSVIDAYFSSSYSNFVVVILYNYRTFLRVYLISAKLFVGDHLPQVTHLHQSD